MTLEQMSEIDRITIKMYQKVMSMGKRGPNITKAKKDGLEGMLRIYLQFQNIIASSEYPLENYRVSPTTSDEIKNTLFFYKSQNDMLLPVSPDANKLLSIKNGEIFPLPTMKEKRKPFFSQTQINQVDTIESLEQLLALMLYYQLSSSRQNKEQQERVLNEIKYYFPRIRNYRDSLTTIPNVSSSIFEWEHISKEERFQSLDRTLSRSFQIDI